MSIAKNGSIIISSTHLGGAFCRMFQTVLESTVCWNRVNPAEHLGLSPFYPIPHMFESEKIEQVGLGPVSPYIEFSILD